MAKAHVRVRSAPVRTSAVAKNHSAPTSTTTPGLTVELRDYLSVKVIHAMIMPERADNASGSPSQSGDAVVTWEQPPRPVSGSRSVIGDR